MKSLPIIIMLILIISFNSRAQLIENFNDGDFTLNPVWVGDTSFWKINSNGQLQSSCSEANISFYLSAENKKVLNAEWNFYVELNFNTSSVNYAEVYLSSSSSNLKQPDLTGYFIRIGNTTDEISLYRKDKLSSVKIIDGADQKLNNSKSILFIKVKRNEKNEWQLFTKVNQFPETMEGKATDGTYPSGDFFGILIKQSTASFFGKHIFDEIVVKELVPDTIAPKIKKINVVEKNKIDIYFDEPVEKNSAELNSNYNVDHSFFMPISAEVDSINNALVHLKFRDSFPPRTILNIIITGISDLSGNTFSAVAKSFHYYIPSPFDIIIDEIMADPSPSVSLPEVEWIELRNNSIFSVNLKGWRIGSSSAISSPFREYILGPDSLLIICNGTALPQLSEFGNALSVTNLPNLNNSGDLLYLLSPEGKSIHGLKYSDSWYKNDLKKSGGWSLEMIDVNRPCSAEENWTASLANTGGTPGKTNSSSSIQTDIISPKVIHAFAEDNLHITIYMSEPVDSMNAVKTNFYSVSEGIGNPAKVFVTGPLFEKIVIELKVPLLNKKIYSISIAGLKDCSGNMIQSNEQILTGLDEVAEASDVVINEILFNPKEEGTDWVELYNRSKKILNLKNIFIGNINALGEANQLNALSDLDRLFFPGTYIVTTKNTSMLLRGYYVKHPDHVFKMENMPSMPDDAGRLVLLNEQGAIIDKLFYDEDWHYKLLNNKEGISLERISSDAQTQEESNWHSAAASVGYGTPTYANSQTIEATENLNFMISAAEHFSPNNDGNDDLLMIHYRFSEPGFVLNLIIYDAAGRRVNHLVKNGLCGINGFYKWDGLDEKKQQVNKGVYVLYAEAFDLKGKIKKYKQTVLLVK